MTPGDRSGEEHILRLNLAETLAAAQGVAAQRFADRVEARSGNKLRVEIYPEMQLAKGNEILGALAGGAVDLQIAGTPVFQTAFPRLAVFDMPFIFKDSAAAFQVLDGSIGAEFFAELETKGLLGLGWGATGFRELETKERAVRVPADVVGLRIRVQNAAVYDAIFKALGAVPVAIDLNEAFEALSEGRVDGLDNPLIGFVDKKFYTLAKHVAMTNHIFSVVAFVGSRRKLEALPDGMRTIVCEEAAAIVPFWRELTERQSAEHVEMLRQNGVAFTEIDYPAFRKAMEPVYAAFEPQLGTGLIERVALAAGAGAAP